MDSNAFEKMTYGVYVIASGNEKRKNAFVATAVIQVTSTPLQIEVACNKKNFTAGIIDESGVFSVSAIKRDYTPAFLGNFGFQSGANADKFANYSCIYGKETGVPIVTDDCIAWFECKVVNKIDVGTHILYIGEVLDCKSLSNNDVPLTYAYYHDVKRGATPKNAPHGAGEEAKPANNNNTNNQNSTTMKKYVCQVCGYVYDPEVGDPDSGIAPGTAFEDIPDDWTCPLCGVSKSDFAPQA